MTKVGDIVRAAIPDATDDDIEHVLWARTPFPCGKVSARDLYKAASGWNRAGAHGLHLCDHCHNIVAPGRRFECEACGSALDKFREQQASQWAA